ncbi:MAG: zf-HC2 domain-containing protein [Acidobacteriia bacterium]|nr:zf-HC2 domain-containing protein [Terriglobia bacterium]
MAMTCNEVWREVSNYIDDSISPAMRKQVELHLSYCRHCAAIIDGVHNIITLVADGRVFCLPAGFSARLHARLKSEL